MAGCGAGDSLSASASAPAAIRAGGGSVNRIGCGDIDPSELVTSLLELLGHADITCSHPQEDIIIAGVAIDGSLGCDTHSPREEPFYSVRVRPPAPP